MTQLNPQDPRLFPLTKLILFILIAILPATVMGCSGAGPVVVGPKHLGIGWFVQHKPLVAEVASADDKAAVCIDVEGTGLLFSPHGCTLGYSRINFVALRPGEDVHVRLSEMDVYTGTAADAEAHAFAIDTWPLRNKEAKR